MSFATMFNEVTGVVPRISSDYARTIVNRAWKDVRRQSLWSFLLFEGNWTTPGIVNAGTVAVTQGSPSVVFDAAASAAINAIGFVPSTVTQRQFRIGIGTIYNIWAWDGVNTATLDRNYQESTDASSSYQIYQVYYAAPVKDWKGWSSIVDALNFNSLDYTKTRAWGDQTDPQRTYYYIPTKVWYFTQDQNPNSATYGFPLFEIWGPPAYQLTYQLYGSRKGVDLALPTDELPNAIGEDVVMALARYYAYEWAAANPEEGKRAVNYTSLMAGAMAQYKGLFKEYRREDRFIVDNFHRKLRRKGAFPSGDGYYSSIAGVASPGSPW